MSRIPLGTSWLHKLNAAFSRFELHPAWMRPHGCTCDDRSTWPYGVLRQRLTCDACMEAVRKWEQEVRAKNAQAYCSMCGEACVGHQGCFTYTYSLGSVEHACDLRAHWFAYDDPDDGVDPVRIAQEGGEYICGKCIFSYLAARMKR
jgi:hypothetical protein